MLRARVTGDNRKGIVASDNPGIGAKQSYSLLIILSYCFSDSESHVKGASPWAERQIPMDTLFARACGDATRLFAVKGPEGITAGVTTAWG